MFYWCRPAAGKKSQFPFRGKRLLSHLAHRASSQGRRWSAKISRHMFNWQNLSLFLTVFGHLCLPSSLAPVLVSTRAPARWLSSKSAMTYAETDFFYTMELYIAEQLQTSNVYFQWTEGDSCVLCSYSATTRLFSWFFRSRATPYLSGPQWRSLLNQIGFPTFILLSFLGVGAGWVGRLWSLPENSNVLLTWLTWKHGFLLTFYKWFIKKYMIGETGRIDAWEQIKRPGIDVDFVFFPIQSTGLSRRDNQIMSVYLFCRQQRKRLSRVGSLSFWWFNPNRADLLFICNTLPTNKLTN